jgi:hypothetical protein
MRRLASVLVLAACTRGPSHTTPSTRTLPTPSVQAGMCSEPPAGDHADRDLDDDGHPEIIVADRAACAHVGDDKQNCHWNVYKTGQPGECTRYIGTFDGGGRETLPQKGDDNMSDVRAYWAQPGGRLLLQSYRFVRGGYQISDVLQCKYAADDRLECAETGR